ncbi:hypothetical protein ACROYT_G035578 [Oculina patagonica]
MATGGGDFGYEDPDLDRDLDHDGDNDGYDDDDEQEVNTTGRFQPNMASTFYHHGEEHEMQTMQHEQSGLPETSYDETPLLGSAQSMSEKAWNALKGVFPESSSTNLEASYSLKGRLQVKMAGAGKKLYDLFTTKRGTGGEQQLNPSLTKEIRKELGPMTQKLIERDDEEIKDERQRLRETEKEVKEGEKIKTAKEKAKQKLQDLKMKKERAQARKDQLGSNVENESELRELEQRIKNYQIDYENTKKEIAALEKQAKQKEKYKKIANQQRAIIAAKEIERNTLQERYNDTKTFNELREKEAELKRQNDEDQAVIEDDNASPSEKQAAEERVAERTEELARLQTQIAERERALPLRERIKEIFKKNGVTVTAIFLAAGVTIGAVIGAITNSLKATGKALGKGLSDVGSK